MIGVQFDQRFDQRGLAHPLRSHDYNDTGRGLGRFGCSSIVEWNVFLLLRPIQIALLSAFGPNHIGHRKSPWIVSIDACIVLLGFLILFLFLRSTTCLGSLVLVMVLCRPRDVHHGQFLFAFLLFFGKNVFASGVGGGPPLKYDGRTGVTLL